MASLLEAPLSFAEAYVSARERRKLEKDKRKAKERKARKEERRRWREEERNVTPAQMAAGFLAWREQQEIEGPESWRDEAADEGDRRGIAARTRQIEVQHVGTATGTATGELGDAGAQRLSVMQVLMNESMALRSALRMDEEEEGQATSAVDPAPSRELPAQILNSTLYSNSMRYAVGTSQYGLDTSQYTVVFTGVVRRGGGNM